MRLKVCGVNEGLETKVEQTLLLASVAESVNVRAGNAFLLCFHFVLFLGKVCIRSVSQFTYITSAIMILYLNW